VLQISLVDTWAATGAGAFTLSENGLYTREAWRVFLDTLKPNGLLSVSRWYESDRPAESARLLALGTAALIDRGVARPADHLALIAHDKVVTLVTSNDPLSDADRYQIVQVAAKFQHNVLLLPGSAPADPVLGRIVGCNTHEALAEAIRNDLFDYSPPTDQSPYFFNALKPSSLLRRATWDQLSVLARGNVFATITLLVLGAIAAFLVMAVILVPLWRAGLPKMDGRAFCQAVLYFALIGMGFMLVQIPLMQRFSVYLGHPTYAIVVILFSMIFFTGLGSLLSDRVRVEAKPALLSIIPLTIAVLVVALTLSIQAVIDATVQLDLAVRCLIVVALVAPVALALGFCFPIGMRLVGRISGDATPWMWGVNGACGVLASVLAVALSLWAGGIHTNLYLAAGMYALLAVPANVLWRKGARAA
jgi:hypothetical protein